MKIISVVNAFQLLSRQIRVKRSNNDAKQRRLSNVDASIKLTTFLQHCTPENNKAKIASIKILKKHGKKLS